MAEMTAAQLQRYQRAARQSVQETGGAGGPDDPGEGQLPDLESATEGPSFADTLENAVESVDEAQKTANEKVSAFVAGEEENLHEVMISMNQAKVKFDLMNEVRSRGLEAYQKLMRMQI